MVWILRKIVQRFHKNLKIKLAYDPSNPSLCIYLKELETGSQRDNYTLMFIAALFTKDEEKLNTLHC